MPGRPLYRPESEQARSTAWLGRVVLIRPMSFTFLTLCALGFAIVLVLFFVCGEYTRKARVTGMLAPAQGVVKILAQQSGIVEAVHVREGDSVDKDAAPVVLGDGRTSRSKEDIGSAVTARLIERHRALLRQREHAYDAMRTEQAGFAARGAGLTRELEQADVELAAQQRRIGVAQHSLGRSRKLEDIGFLSPAAVDRERDAALDQESRLEALRRSRLAVARELASGEVDAQTARSRAQSQLAASETQRP